MDSSKSISAEPYLHQVPRLISKPVYTGESTYSKALTQPRCPLNSLTISMPLMKLQSAYMPLIREKRSLEPVSRPSSRRNKADRDEESSCEEDCILTLLVGGGDMRRTILIGACKYEAQECRLEG